MSLFLIYFGTRRKYPRLLHHNIMFGPRYRELLNDIFQRRPSGGRFLTLPSRAVASDPKMAPPGCDTFYVLSPVPHLGKARIDWEVEGPRYGGKGPRIFGAALHAGS